MPSTQGLRVLVRPDQPGHRPLQARQRGGVVGQVRQIDIADSNSCRCPDASLLS